VEDVGELMSRKYNQRYESKNDSVTKEECLNNLCKDFGIKSVDDYKELNRTKRELFLFIYRRVMFIFGFNITTKYPEDPSKSDAYFKVFCRFYSKNLEYKTILKTSNKRTIDFWKSLFAGKGNKDVYKVPPTPDMRIFVEDPDRAEQVFQEQVEEYRRRCESDGHRLSRIVTISENIKKQKMKLEKTEKADIPKGFKIQARNKIAQNLKSLEEDLKQSRIPTVLSEPVYRMQYKQITNPEWEKHMDMLVKGSRRDLIKLGWLQPGEKPTSQRIKDNIIQLLEQGSDYDVKYRVRLALDNKNMLVETESNDFWKKIHVLEESDLQMNIDDFLNKTVEMFFDMIDQGLSNKTAKLVKYLCAGQETRILCSIISYYSEGYISKKFLPLRKKHRREICSLLDKLIR
jgi:hypothetical protein